MTPETSTRPRAVLCLFAKPPVAGEVKTRLAADIGDETAARLADAFLRDTWASLGALADTIDADLVLASTTRDADEPLNPPRAVWLQGGGDLGARIERILARGLAAAPIAVALGADSPGLPAARIVEAIEAVETDHDAALIPADDGGFVLLALRRCPSGLLADLPWSTAQTFARVLARLEASGLATAVLDPWFDVDELPELQHLATAIARGELRAPRTEAALAAASLDLLPDRPGLSVIVPVLDEAARISGQLRSLLALDGVDEIVVVDGGSTDPTPDIVARMQAAHPARVRLLHGPRGRARQMNHGADRARGETLLFLHADVRLPARARQWVDHVLAEPDVVAGAFRTWTVDDAAPDRLRPWLHLADVRSRYTNLPYGDQALFLRRETFEEVGGFPDMPLMEDLELSIRLRRLGTIRTARASVLVSGRRFVERPVFYTLLVNIYPLLYRLGVPPELLARFYRAVR